MSLQDRAETARARRDAAFSPGFAIGSIVTTALLLLAWSPIPDWNETQVATSGVEDTFDPLRTFVAEFESGAGAGYHVLFVEYSDAEDREGPTYGDDDERFILEVFERWRGSLDVATDNIIVVSTSNRDVIVHPGSEWAALGFEDAEVTATIYDSPMGEMARRGDYGGAVEALIRRIDERISELQTQRAADIEELEEGLAVAPDALSAVLEDLDPQFVASSEDVADARERYAAELAEIRRLMNQGRVARAIAALESLPNDLAWTDNSLREANDAFVANRESVMRANEQIEETEDAFNAMVSEYSEAVVGGTPGIDAERLAFNESIEQARSLASSGKGDEALESVAIAQLAVEATRALLDEEAARQRARTVLYPAIASVVLLLFIGLFGSWRMRAAQKQRQRALSLLDNWNGLLDAASQKLVELQDQHVVFLGIDDPIGRFEEGSLVLAKECARLVDRLFLGFAAMEAVRAEAAKKVEEAAPWALGELNAAEALLTTAEVVLGKETRLERKLSIPDQVDLTLPAHGVFNYLSSTYDAATRKLGLLEREIEAYMELETEFADDLAEEEYARLDLLELGVTIDVPESIIETARAELESAYHDPMHDLDGARAAIEALRVRSSETRRLDEAITKVRGPLNGRSQELEQRVEELRVGELALSEPGFEPDEMLDHVDQCLERALRSAGEFDVDATEEWVAEASDTLDELHSLIESTIELRDEGPARLEALARDLKRTRTDVPAVAEALGRLRVRFEDDALQPALDNAEEIDAICDNAELALDEARLCMELDRQHYLRMGEIIDRLEELLAQTRALFDEVPAKEKHLDAALDHTRQNVAKGQEQIEALIPYEGNKPSLWTAPQFEEIERAKKELATIGDKVLDARNHPLELEAESARLVAFFEALLLEGEREVVAIEKYDQLLPAVRLEHEAVKRLLDEKVDDRDRANDARKMAWQALDDAQEYAARFDWEEALGALEESNLHLQTARALAAQDATAAEAARRALREADSARSTYAKPMGYGVRPDLSRDVARLEQARQLLAQQQYERALSVAREARSGMSRAVQVARRQVSARRKAEVMPFAIGSATDTFSGSSSRRRHYGSSSSGGRSFGAGFSSGGGSYAPPPRPTFSRRTTASSLSSSRSTFKKSRSSFGSSSAGRSSFGSKSRSSAGKGKF